MMAKSSMIVKNQKLRDETVLEIGKFAILWNYFEHTYCDDNCSSKKIKQACENLMVDKQKMFSFSGVLNKRRGLLGLSEAEYINKSMHPQNAINSSENDKQAMCAFLEGRCGELEYGCLLIIYRIRNNLMHGLKMLSELDSQIELFRAASEVLESINNK